MSGNKTTGDASEQGVVNLVQLAAVLIPDQNKFSALLKMKHIRPYLRYMNNLKEKLEYKKRPH